MKKKQAQFIPVNTPLLDGNEKKYLNECIDTNWISSEGPFVKRFEYDFSRKVNRLYGVAVTNGTAALQVAIVALGIQEGDEVIMPTFTIISCAQAVVKVGAKPVLVDSDANTWNMDVKQIESKITSKTKAIMAVHIYGLPVDMDPVVKLAGKYDLKIIEDAAQAIGQTYKGKPCGSFGEISTFSFYPNKHITTGEGGMIVTNDQHIYERCKRLRNLCFKKSPRFVHDEMGWNFRMTNLQAALGVAQLENLDKHIVRKKEIGRLYNSLLKKYDKFQFPVEKTDFAENIYWVFGIVLKNHMTAKELATKLLECNIATRPFFYPMHKQPVFYKMMLFPDETYPNAERMAEYGLYLPSGLGITNEEIECVSETLIRIIKLS